MKNVGDWPRTSTRSNKSEDAYRDMDGFDENEELRRFRLAIDEGRGILAAELAANLDEHCSRGGDLPAEWLGPKCMRTKKDREYRHAQSLKKERALRRKAGVMKATKKR